MGLIKDRKGIDLTEAEDIKKRWQEYTELYKKELHDPDNHDGVITLVCGLLVVVAFLVAENRLWVCELVVAACELSSGSLWGLGLQ